MVVLCGSGGGMRKCMWAPEQKFGEIWAENGAVDGDVAAMGRMSRLDGRMSGLLIHGRTRRSSRGEVKSGQNSGKFVDGNWGKVDGELDLPATHEIRRSNPTTLHHTNKSQKNGAIFVGNF